MTLLVQEVIEGETLYQTVTPSKITQVSVIRPHLYLHNQPTGNLIIRITASDGTVLATSETINLSTITTYDEFHGYISFYINAMLMKDTPYIIELVSSSYTFDESSYAGWCNGFDLAKYSNSDPVTVPQLAPLDLEIWELTKK